MLMVWLSMRKYLKTNGMELIEALIGAIGEDKVLLGAAVHERYHHIWHMDQRLDATAVLLPRTTEEVSAIMKICHKLEQPVIVHGGLTNLVGSTETSANEVVISMEKLNMIEEVDEGSRTMTVQAGVLLQQVQDKAKDSDLLFPLNFGAKGSAQIGGIISTNAGGLRVFRYGMTRNLVLGLETVLADGTIVSSLKKIIKDNSAYDLKQLFIGSEGTLGIVTKAVLKLVEAPRSRTSAFVGINGFSNVVLFLKHMDSGFAGTLSGFELIWADTFKIMTCPPASVKAPLPFDYEFYVLLEGLGSHQENDQQRLEGLLAEALQEKLIVDAVIADTAADLNWFWTIREDVHVLVEHCNHDQHFDISLPIPLIGETIHGIQQQLLATPKVENVYAFGHMADGNIHLIVGKEEQSEELISKINDIVYGPLQAIGGSVSAEHGIGVHKKKYLHLCRTSEEITLMKTMKQVMDPKTILNRGKVI